MIDVKRGENISLLKITPQLNEIIVAVKWFKKLLDYQQASVILNSIKITEIKGEPP